MLEERVVRSVELDDLLKALADDEEGHPIPCKETHRFFQEGKGAKNRKLIQEEQDAVLEFELAIACFTLRETANDKGDE